VCGVSKLGGEKQVLEESVDFGAANMDCCLDLSQCSTLSYGSILFTKSCEEIRTMGCVVVQMLITNPNPFTSIEQELSISTNPS
jgi:hypothetical protein